MNFISDNLRSITMISSIDQKKDFAQVADRLNSDDQIIDSIKIDQPYSQIGKKNYINSILIL